MGLAEAVCFVHTEVWVTNSGAEVANATADGLCHTQPSVCTSHRRQQTPMKVDFTINVAESCLDCSKQMM